MKTLILGLCSILIVSFVALAVSSSPAFAQARQEVINGARSANATPSNKVETTVENAVNLVTYIVGIVAVIMIVIAGIQFITAQGDSSSIARARTVLIYAAVGLVIVALAQTIVRFVLRETGV